ncbi:hypothetical protein [Streptomyces sp. NPDC093261]|uniref:hypothetical protein n=1 Tax=Streptomyces sp. NPDC093261 TaxID=3366037 RepID=UPI00382A5A74
MDCGCHQPTNGHGDERHITLDELIAAAQASGLPIEQAAQNIPATLRNATGAPSAFDDVLRRPALVCDIDGILAFAAEAIATALNARYGAHYRAETMPYQIQDVIPDVQGVWLRAEYGRGDLYANMAPNLDAIRTVGAAHDAGWTVIITTARDPALVDVTTAWLDRWHVKRDALNLVGRGNKPAWMASHFGPSRPALLLDDQPAYQLSIARPGIEVWTPRLPYTPPHPRPHVRVFDDWPQIAAALGVTF